MYFPNYFHPSKAFWSSLNFQYSLECCHWIYWCLMLNFEDSCIHLYLREFDQKTYLSTSTVSQDWEDGDIYLPVNYQINYFLIDKLFSKKKCWRLHVESAHLRTKILHLISPMKEDFQFPREFHLQIKGIT